MKLLKLILDWTEVWALLIPLGIVCTRPKQPSYIKPVVYYAVLALLINLFADIIESFRRTWHFPHWLWTNNWVYNFHSIVRFICFSIFFNRIDLTFFKLRKRISFLALIFIIVNFIFFENFFDFESFSSRLLTIEAALLLFFCLQYYLSRIREDQPTTKRNPDFWVVTGLSIYVVVNFFIFLFYKTLVHTSHGKFARDIWDVHNISYIVFCLFLAKAFYDAPRR